MIAGEVRAIRVLLVEDHNDTATSLSKLLKMDGYMVHVALGFKAAAKLASELSFDVLLADISLPDGNGTHLMEMLVAQNQSIKGIAISGYGAEEDVKMCNDAGFSAHLLKPVTFEKLKDVLGQICEDLRNAQKRRLRNR